MRVAYFDCFAGASGDMILGALVDAGLPLPQLVSELQKLPLEGYTITARAAQRSVLSGTKVDVQVDEHLHEHHRNLGDILGVINASTLPMSVKEGAGRVFQRLAQAEAKIHGQATDAVHFHEVGAVDAIVDVVGSVLGLHLLGVERVYASALTVGGGLVASAHGVLPVPAPATLELIAMAQAPLRTHLSGDLSRTEALTPTAAAILTTLAIFGQPTMTVEKVGHGVGSRELPQVPNVLRLWLGEEVQTTQERSLLLLETNIDDMNPELWGYVMEQLFARGALDVWFTPIQMKKNRPAVMLSVLAPEELQTKMVETVLRETSTLGLRLQRVQRHETGRQEVRFTSSLGPVAVKVKRLDGADFSLAPEYEDCRRIALEKGLPLQEVYRIVSEEAQRQLE